MSIVHDENVSAAVLALLFWITPSTLFTRERNIYCIKKI